jgi:hypothetical protein
METDDDVLQGVVETVAHVEDTGYVGRRNYDDKGLLPFRAFGRLEGPLLLPHRIHAILETFRVVGFVELHGIHAELLQAVKNTGRNTS